MKGVGSSRRPFPRQGAKVRLFPRDPPAIIGCSHPDLCLSWRDRPVGPKFLCLFQGLSVDLWTHKPNCPLNVSASSHIGPLKVNVS